MNTPSNYQDLFNMAFKMLGREMNEAEQTAVFTVANMVENTEAGQLRSRQTVAAILYFVSQR